MRNLVIAFTLLTATVASAQDLPVRGQGVRGQGVGTLSCGKYLQLRAEKIEVQDGALVSWIWGYMTGFNMEVRQPTIREWPDQPSTLTYIDKYCRDNPLDNVLIATNALIKDLGGKRNAR